MNYSGVQAAKMRRQDNLLRTITGTQHRILLRRFVEPTEEEFSDIYKEASRKSETPSKEEVILAKVRPLSDTEMTTEIGMYVKGDLVISVGAEVRVTNLDEVRFVTDSVVEGSQVRKDWDYVVHESHPTHFSDLSVAQTFIARRKAVATDGGSRP